MHAEGFIERHVGSGSFVSERARRLPGLGKSRRAEADSETPRLSQRGSAMFQGGGVRDFLISRPFAPSVPETRSFPLAVWERLERQILKEYGTQALLHSPSQGMEPLCRAIANHVNLEHGARATPERVLILTSSQQALTLCAKVLLDVGDKILLEYPTYHGARKAFDAAGLISVPVPLDADGVRVDQLFTAAAASETLPRAVFLTQSHQFPSSATLSFDRRLAVIEWARQTPQLDHRRRLRQRVPLCGQAHRVRRGWTCTSARSISAPSRNHCFPACVSAIWCCRRHWWLR
ncbi:MAG: aminotransferase class I/II-fold pyridoxal phosphate-dependent enzyme [Symbiopectobacterium sp.]|uniref:aminotransferase class I/II-fold pyridoxal phosphate-dependent enzyme n=1 Tax=Symbiopectobacterium sp. TaxID=2952789 RepID=UPI003F2A9438